VAPDQPVQVLDSGVGVVDRALRQQVEGGQAEEDPVGAAPARPVVQVLPVGVGRRAVLAGGVEGVTPFEGRRPGRSGAAGQAPAAAGGAEQEEQERCGGDRRGGRERCTGREPGRDANRSPPAHG
jgi:hypothetical protein